MRIAGVLVMVVIGFNLLDFMDDLNCWGILPIGSWGYGPGVSPRHVPLAEVMPLQ